MKTRFGFAGFRHSHILDLLAAVEARVDCEVVACCEEHAETRAELAAAGRVKITHADFSLLLHDVPCEVVAIGDYYSRRGALVIAALTAGKHVLGDKPLCTTLDEQTEIERLCVEKNLVVGLQFDSRGSGAFRALREIIRSGEIGEVCTIRIDAQHPLLPGSRPGWYFEPGKHGGTINDIGIHAFDFIPWLTGLEWRGIVAARTWNAKAAPPHFHDCAQFMATLANSAGVLADLSYLAPDRLGYKLPHYWHLLIHGTRGLAETHLLSDKVTVITDLDAASRSLAAAESRPHLYLADFLKMLTGTPADTEFQQHDFLRASRLALAAQLAAADS